MTPEEHYVAHQLLVKMHPGNDGLVSAAVYMACGTSKQSRNNKLYGWLRRRHAERQRANLLGAKRAPHTQETKAKMSAASLGRTKSDAHRQALSMAKKLAWQNPAYRDAMVQRQHERRIREGLRG